MIGEIIVELDWVFCDTNISTVSLVKCLGNNILVLGTYVNKLVRFRLLAYPKVVIINIYFVKSQKKCNLIDVSVESLGIKSV